MILQQTTKRPNVRIKCLVLGAAAAGKTSLIRRFFYNKFDDGTRVPTLGSDWYTASVEAPAEDEDEKEDIRSAENREDDDNGDSALNGRAKPSSSVLVGIQMWDTPGRERFDAKRQRQQQRPIEDAFLLQADAVMLVYDMTSSTSFTQLLKWFRDLSKLDDRPPILVCANKLDLFVTMQRQHHHHRGHVADPGPPKSLPAPPLPRIDRRERVGTRGLVLPPTLSRRRAGSHGAPPPTATVEVRDVMGLRGQFRGNDIQYEYQVSDEGPGPGGSDGNLTTARNGYRRRAGSVSSTASQPTTLSMPIYLADRENWTSDGSYLESLLTTEDQSFPDIEMVKLWCLRNGLAHVESSAATGVGVEAAFALLVKIGLAEKKRRREEEEANESARRAVAALESRVVPPGPPPVVRRNDPIDFSKRYAPKEEPCWCVPLLRPLLLLLRLTREAS